jgi:hypothetical protein
VVTLCLVELCKVRHDLTELLTRAIQPTLWLLIYGETLNTLRAMPLFFASNALYPTHLMPAWLHRGR